jgi:hypothetical protein
MITYLYIRPHKNDLTEMSITGYKNEQEVYTIGQKAIKNQNWQKVNMSNKVIDTLRLPVNTEIDDIMIIHDSEYSDTIEYNDELASILQNVIEDIIENPKGKKIKEEDI